MTTSASALLVQDFVPPPGILEVAHETVYDYAQPVAQSHHIAHLRPLADTAQGVIQSELRIEPVPDAMRDSRDSFGNACVHFALCRPHRSLRVLALTRVEIHARFAGLDPDSSPPWERVRDALRYVARAPFDPAVEFVQPSPFVPRHELFRQFGLLDFLPGRPVVQAAQSLMHRIHREFKYQVSSTDIGTPVVQAFEQRVGVCQDFAHVMIGVCRMLGVPARYVSGYLLTRPAAEGPALVGADASHAWVQVYAPGTLGVPPDGWLDLDPTNDLVPGVEHVRLAIGRDFGDVTPLRGVIRGGGAHTLKVGVTTRKLPSGCGSGPVVAKPFDER
jgi:transglutaminase-like putative cysteine protease